MKDPNTRRLSLYLDEKTDTHIRTLHRAFTEEVDLFPSGVSMNQFVMTLIGVGAERMREMVYELREL